MKTEVKPETVITEDRNSGYQFFQSICSEHDLECCSADGKSNIFRLLKERKEERVLVIADGAAFGPEMDRVLQLLTERENSALYLPESFEWLILRSGVIEDSGLGEILKNPENYIESGDYFSWERYFTSQLIRITRDSYLRYAKRKLNPAYLQEKISDRILAVMHGIKFKR